MRIFRLLILGALLAASTASWAEETPDLVKFQLCPTGEQDFRLIQFQGGVFWAYENYVLDCASSPDLKVYRIIKDLDKVTKKFVTRGYQWIHDIRKTSPRSLFLAPTRKSFADRILSVVPLQVDHNFAGLAFSLRAKSDRCPAGQSLVSTTFATANKHDAVTFAEDKSTGLCLTGEIKALGANVLAYEVPEKGQAVTAALLGKNEILGLEVNHRTGAATERFRLSGEPYLPRECGEYLKGLRFLPGTTKVALFYASPRVVFYDWSTSTATEVYNGNDPDMGKTCEGVEPTHDLIKSVVRIDERSRKVYYTNRNWKKKQLEETEIGY